ncbi:hypothetical protein SAMN05216302_101287 [Nitrosomonas aestuarii]|uniref:Uncharacterized protein n=1 Tax=Nitrosomonas aestuarii TaxID=52441 RepID=A0A1I4BL97_9PROT|nr:hypothetical protein [Nitrosomonas aestuarii]SFK69505.1 hypothetical protein SAMN05216302_101287 [Nitrosomonas aestuarii]
MNETHYAKGIKAQNLRAFLELWSLFEIGIKETKDSINDCSDRLLDKEESEFSWCYLYEFPANELVLILLSALTGFVKPDQIVDWLKQMANTPGNIGELPDIFDQVNKHFEERADPTYEDLEAIRSDLPMVSAAFTAMQYSLFCLLYHGCYLNELIERVRNGDTKALFDAIKIDTSVIGCPSVVDKISTATRLQDKRFFAKLKSAINGKKEKLSQINFQKMRLVFKILHEVGATRLTDAQLYHLFVEELKLYTSNAKGGGVDKALRKFADTYMKQYATT